jgi:hypothetical protein
VWHHPHPKIGSVTFDDFVRLLSNLAFIITPALDLGFFPALQTWKIQQ